VTPSPIPTSLYSDTPAASAHNYPAVLKDRGPNQKCRVPPPVPPRSPKRGGGHHFAQHHYHRGGESPSSPNCITALSPVSAKPRRRSSPKSLSPEPANNKAKCQPRPELAVHHNFERKKHLPTYQGGNRQHFNGLNNLSNIYPKHYLHSDESPHAPTAAFDGMRPRNALHPRPYLSNKGGLSPADSTEDPEFYV